ncbi:hypothetical protein KUCAC02_003313, partial [Chaenocephalus aceratus]
FFLALMETAGLTDLLKEKGSYTMFAPTDDAFEGLSEEDFALLKSDLNVLRIILLYHFSNGIFINGGLEGGGNNLQVISVNNSINVNSVDVPDSDLMATNGVIHVVKNVLYPADLPVGRQDFLVLLKKLIKYIQIRYISGFSYKEFQSHSSREPSQLHIIMKQGKLSIKLHSCSRSLFTVPETKVTRVIQGEPTITKVTRVIEGEPTFTKVTRVIEGEPTITTVTRVIEGEPSITKVTRVIEGEPSITKVTRVIEGEPSITKVTRVIEGEQSITKVTRVIEGEPSITTVTRVIEGEPSITKVTRVIEGHPSITKVTRVIETEPVITTMFVSGETRNTDVTQLITGESSSTRVFEGQPIITKVTRVIETEPVITTMVVSGETRNTEVTRLITGESSSTRVFEGQPIITKVTRIIEGGSRQTTVNEPLVIEGPDFSKITTIHGNPNLINEESDRISQLIRDGGKFAGARKAPAGMRRRRKMVRRHHKPRQSIQ